MRQEHDRQSKATEGILFEPHALLPTASAVEAAYAAHYGAVFRYALALTRSPSDAEDITAEAFIRALRSWREVPSRPLPWLLLVTRRIATDRRRRAARFLRSARRLAAATADAGEARTEFWAWFDALRSVLTDRQREALVLRYERDLTDAEIGDVLGLSESGVRSLIARALAALRAHPELL